MSKRFRHTARGLAVAFLVGLSCALPLAAQSIDGHECYGEDNERRLKACSELIEMPGVSPENQSGAFAMRALSYSLKGNYDQAIRDYDQAIRIVPDFAVALNNRAWAYFKSGRPEMGIVDVEKSLALDPSSAHTYDTRAHIKQWGGRPSAALADYERAMAFGGPRMIKLYQCGLAAAGLYKGPADGLTSYELQRAMEACVQGTTCDPLPPDEECKAATS
ncbi:MAG: tetratricopeptide repeat protein [Hyphomicrobiaceae bacterium]